MQGFADWFTKDYCSRKLFVGQVIMNNKAVASEERYVRVFRGTKELKSGDVYQPSESLTISINEAKHQYVYEVSEGGAKFEKGGCEGRRIADKPKVTLNMPAKGAASASEFEIIIGWATGHEEVRISPAFRLVSAEGMAHHETPKLDAKDVKSKSKLSTLSGKSRKKLDVEEEVEDQMAVNALFENESEGKREGEHMIIEEEGESEHDTINEADHHPVHEEKGEEEHGEVHHRHLPHDAPHQEDHHLHDSLAHEHEGSEQHHASSEHDELDHAPKHAPEVEQHHEHEEHRTADHREHDHPDSVGAAEGIPPPPVVPGASSHEMQELQDLHTLADHIHHLDEQHNGQDAHQKENSHHRSNHVDQAKEQGHGLEPEPEPLSSIFHRERAEDVHDHDKHADTLAHKGEMPLHGRPNALHDHHEDHNHDSSQHDNNHHDNDHHDLRIQHERENDFQGFHEEDHHHQDHHPAHDAHHEQDHEPIHDSNHHDHDHERAADHHHEHEDNHHEHNHEHLPGATEGEGASPDHHLKFGAGLGLGGVHPSPFGDVQDHFNRLHDQVDYRLNSNRTIHQPPFQPYLIFGHSNPRSCSNPNLV